MKILLLDKITDEREKIACYINLRWPTSKIIQSGNGNQLIDLIEKESPDLVLMEAASDHGLTTIETIRSVSDVPIVLLIRSDDEVAKISGLELGADDYVTKPFNPIEFLAKLAALLRRIHGENHLKGEVVHTYGRLSVNFSSREVYCNGERVKLTPTEYSLLSHLAKNEGKVLTHSALLERVWGRDYVGEPCHVKKYIYRLRSKLGDDANNPTLIISERGVGYKFKATA